MLRLLFWLLFLSISILIMSFYKKKMLNNAKLREENLRLQIKNSNNMSDALRDVEFGIIPNIVDNRSRNEILNDGFTTQKTALENASKLFDNDIVTAQNLLNKIGQPNYLSFNRYFINIYSALESQKKYLTANSAYEFINNYLEKQEYNSGIRDIIPTESLLNGIISRIEEQNTINDTTKQDLINKLEALTATLTQNKNVNKILYDKLKMVTASKISELLESDDDSFIDDVTNATSNISRDTIQQINDGDSDDNIDYDDGNDSDSDLSAIDDVGNDSDSDLSAIDDDTNYARRLRNEDEYESDNESDLYESLVYEDAEEGPELPVEVDIDQAYLKSNYVTAIMARISTDAFYSKRSNLGGDTNVDRFKRDVENLIQTTSRIETMDDSNKRPIVTQLNRVLKMLDINGVSNILKKTIAEKFHGLKLNQLIIGLKTLESSKLNDQYVTPSKNNNGSMMNLRSKENKDDEEKNSQPDTKLGSGLKHRLRKIRKSRR
jgi:hypothetical protein